MNIPKIDLEELRERQRQNEAERLAFTKWYARRVKEGKEKEVDLSNR